MQTVPAFMNRLLVVGAVASMMFSCTSSKLSQVQTVPVAENVATITATPESEAAPAAAQGAQSAETYASTSDKMATTATVISTLEKARQENRTVVQKQPAKKLSLPGRIVVKALTKKLEKAQRKFDAKKENAAKADGLVRTGIIIAVIGLAVLLVGALTDVGVLYTLGAIGIVVGLVILLLAALDVI